MKSVRAGTPDALRAICWPPILEPERLGDKVKHLGQRISGLPGFPERVRCYVVRAEKRRTPVTMPSPAAEAAVSDILERSRAARLALHLHLGEQSNDSGPLGRVVQSGESDDQQTDFAGPLTTAPKNGEWSSGPAHWTTHVGPLDTPRVVRGGQVPSNWRTTTRRRLDHWTSWTTRKTAIRQKK